MKSKHITTSKTDLKKSTEHEISRNKMNQNDPFNELFPGNERHRGQVG